MEKALPAAFDIKFAFNKWTLGAEFLRDEIGVELEAFLAAPSFSTCWRGSVSPSAQIEAANVHVCGAMTVECCI